MLVEQSVKRCAQKPVSDYFMVYCYYYAGMFALRERRIHVTQDDFEMAVAKVMKKDSESNMSLNLLWK